MHTDANRFYEILQLDPAASDKAVRLAFRRRAKELHPDAPTGDAASFILLKRAYDTLANRDRRAEYDRSCQPPPAWERPAGRPAHARPPLPPRMRPRRQGGVARYVVAFLIVAAISIGGVQAMISFTEAPPSIRTRDVARTDPVPSAEPSAVDPPAGPGSSRSGFWDPSPTPAPRRN